MELFLALFISIIGLMLLSVAWSSISLAPFVPARKYDLDRILRLADLKEGEVFYELGCGNGRVAIWVAKQSKAKVVGIELLWLMWLVCEIRRLLIRRKDIDFRFGDLFKQDLSQADVIYFFGMPASVKTRLREKLEKELKPGTRVISYVFGVPGWQPELVDKPGKKDISIYLYKR